MLNSRSLTVEFKRLRHGINSIIKGAGFFSNPIKQRDSLRDTGMNVYGQELKRSSCRDIFFANIQRVKESVRVLEEFSKLKSRSAALAFKRVRYKAYTLEKKIEAKLPR